MKSGPGPESGSVGATRDVAGLRHGMHDGEKALGKFVGFTFPDLVRLHDDQRVVAALGLDGDGDLPDRAGELPAAGALRGRCETRAEESRGAFHHLIGIDRGSVEVFHLAQ